MSLDIQRIHALCFDIDGTLSDTDDQFVQKLARFLRPFHFLFKNKDENKTARRLIMAAETPGNWLMSLPDRFGIDDELAAAAHFINRYNPRPSLKQYSMISGVLEMLELLQPIYQMSIVSSRGRRFSLQFLDTFNLRHFFPVIATAQTCPHTKPFPDPVLWAAIQMGVPAEDCLMIGDTVVDILAGKAAGTQTVGVLCGFGKPDELQRAGADLLIGSTGELTTILLQP